MYGTSYRAGRARSSREYCGNTVVVMARDFGAPFVHLEWLNGYLADKTFLIG
jgi:hypothetical protein